MAVPETLRRLLLAAGPSGYEGPAAAVWREAASEFADVTYDTLGSSLARVAGTGGGLLLAIVGHIDEIGLIVTHVDDQGFVYFRNVGGWSPEVLLGQRVEISTRSGPRAGIVGREQRKRLKPGEERPVLQLEELHIDIGARDGDEARSIVAVGDVAVIDVQPIELPNGRIASRALDNRLGAYVALEAARTIAEAGGAPGDVVAIAAVQEEVGDFAGARTSVFALEPDVAIAVDVTPTTDYPGGDPKETGERKLGDGPVLTRGSTANPRILDLLRETAEAEGIRFAVEVTTDKTSTDMDAIHLSRMGVAASLVSIPTRYLHTPVEMCALEDVEACVRLIAAFAQRLEPGMSFAR